MANSMSDEELMAQVRSGVGEMLGVLFERYHVPLFNFYLKLTGDRTASEDLVQEVFFRILKYRHSYRPETAFRAWMYQIARNARVDLLRKRRPETSFEAEMSPAVAPVDTAQQSQEALLLHSALMQISEDKREVLVLSRFQDLKYEEIAQLLGCEVATVKPASIVRCRTCGKYSSSLKAEKDYTARDGRGDGLRPGVCNELRRNWRIVTGLSAGQTER